MSTNIRNGLILRGARLEDALRLLISLRSEAVVRARRAAARRAARLISLSRDLAENVCEIPRRIAGHDLFSMCDSYREAKEKVLGRQERDVYWDFTFDVALIPHKGDTLALFYVEPAIEQLDYRSLLIDSGFQDFSYQNSTDDLPAGVTEQDWLVRAERWRDALPRGMTPAAAGLIYQVVLWDDYHPALLTRGQMEAFLPNENERRRRASRRLTEEGPGFSLKGLRLIDIDRRIRALEPDRRSSVRLSADPLGLLG